MDVLVKLLSVIVAATALYTGYLRWVAFRYGRRWEEYLHVKEFVADVNAGAHNLAVEKGFLAITKEKPLSAYEIRSLLKLPSPLRSLHIYPLARKYVYIARATPERPRILFSAKYTRKKRKHLKCLYTTFYFVSAFVSLLPAVFVGSIFGTDVASAMLFILIWAFAYWLLAYLFLTEYGRVRRSEELFVSQRLLTRRSSGPRSRSAA